MWDDGRLRFYDPAVRDFLPNLSEYKRQAAAERAERIMSERRANAERAERIMSERRAAASERRAESERAARIKAEADLERLRRRLGGL